MAASGGAPIAATPESVASAVISARPPLYDTDRVWTLPNVLSFLRLAGAPLMLWLIIGPQADGLAVFVLALGGFTDWLDGHLARAWHQTSRIGQMLDPIADRLYILAVLLGLALRGIIPWWLVAIVSLAARMPRWFCSCSCPFAPMAICCWYPQQAPPLIVAYTRYVPGSMSLHVMRTAPSLSSVVVPRNSASTAAVCSCRCCVITTQRNAT